MKKIRAGWRLTGKSWGVLRTNRSLLLMPVYGGLSVLVVLAVTVLPGAYLIDTHEYGPGVPLLAAGLYLLAFTGVYFGVALAASADSIFHGRESSPGDGMRVARSRIGGIAGWAVVSASVGAIMALLESSSQAGEEIAGRLMSAAWSLITFLAVPTIAIEGTGPIETLKRSASIFRERWAGQVTGQAAIGGLVVLLGILPAIALAVLGVVLWIDDGNGEEVAAGAVLVAVGVALLTLSAVVLHALRGIFGVALYRYATSGEGTGPFSAEELESAVRKRR